METTPFRVKHNRDQEKVGLQKKSKTIKMSLDPITLIEDYLNEIGNATRDATMELLHQFE